MPVISATVTNVKVANLTENVTYHIPPPSNSDDFDPTKAICVFWDDESKNLLILKLFP